MFFDPENTGEKMNNGLQRVYWKVLMPAFALILFSEINKSMHWFEPQISKQYSSFGPAIFFLSAISALAAPLLYRIVFIKKIKKLKQISVSVFYDFEKKTIYIVLLTPYLFFAASLLQLAAFYYLSVFLLSLYACYYYYPTQKRIHFEKKIFRISDEL